MTVVPYTNAMCRLKKRKTFTSLFTMPKICT